MKNDKPHFNTTNDSIALYADGELIGYLDYSIETIDSIESSYNETNIMLDVDSLRLHLDENEQVAYMELLYINDEYRRNGYGKALMEEFIRTMHDKGIFQFVLRAFPYNDGDVPIDISTLKRFYSKFGFKTIDENQYDGALMYKV